MCRRPLAYGHATATRIFLGVSGPFTGANDRESLSRDPPGSESACGHCCGQCRDERGEDASAGVGVRPSRLRVARAARVPRWSSPGRTGAADATVGGSRETAAVGPRTRDGTARRGDGRRDDDGGRARRARAPSPSLSPATRLPRGGSSAPGPRRTAHCSPSRFDAASCHRSSSSWSSLAAHLRSARPRLRPTDTGAGVAGGVTAAGLSGTADVGGEGSGAGCGAGGASGVGRREGGAPRRKEGERVDVGLGGADADAEVDVRNAVLGVACRAGFGKDVALRDDIAAADVQRAQVGERDLGVADGDRHRQAVRRNGAGERHLSRDRRANRQQIPRAPRRSRDADRRRTRLRRPRSHGAPGRPPAMSRRTTDGPVTSAQTSTTPRPVAHRVVRRANMDSTVPRDRAGGNAL